MNQQKLSLVSERQRNVYYRWLKKYGQETADGMLQAWFEENVLPNEGGPVSFPARHFIHKFYETLTGPFTRAEAIAAVREMGYRKGDDAIREHLRRDVRNNLVRSVPGKGYKYELVPFEERGTSPPTKLAEWLFVFYKTQSEVTVTSACKWLNEQGAKFKKATVASRLSAHVQKGYLMPPEATFYRVRKENLPQPRKS